MTENLKLYGYDYQSRQPCVVIMQRVADHSGFNADHADQWLEKHFFIAAERLERMRAVERVSDHAGTEALLLRALFLYSEMLAAAKIPVFDPGRVLSLRTDEGDASLLTARLALPVIDDFALDALVWTFRQCLKLTGEVLNRDPAQTDCRKALEAIDAQLVRKLDQKHLFRDSTIPVFQLYFDSDIPYRHIGQGVMRMGQGAQGFKQKCASFDGDSAIGSSLSYDKFLTGTLFRAAGLPVGQHFMAPTDAAAKEAARKLGWPVVVKPIDDSQSLGVTTNITDDAQLMAAMAHARKRSRNIMVEKHVPGTCHRLTIIHGEMLYAIIRRAKGVKGNGHDTVRQLVDTQNADRAGRPPWQRSKPFPLDDEAIAILSGQGLTPDSVPTDGQPVDLRPITSRDDGGSVEELTHVVHPENVKIAKTAAAVVGLVNAGVDMMTTDITRPWYETGAIINEINYRPGIQTWGREKSVARFVPLMLPQSGRIPVHLVTGDGNCVEEARALRQQIAEKGRACFLAGPDRSEDSEGQPIRTTSTGLLERSIALLYRPDVEELVIAGNWPEDFTHGFAVDRFDTVKIITADPASHARIEKAVSARTRFAAVKSPPGMAETANQR